MSTVITPEVVASHVVLSLPVNSAGNGLTGRQRIFCQAWVKTRNGLQSAIEAGYTGEDATLRSTASENLTKPNIRAYIDELFSELAIGHAETLAELGQIARFDVLANPDSPIRATDKLKALELAGKALGLWDRQETQLALDPDQLVTVFALAFERLRAQRLAEQQAQLPPVTPSEPTP